MASTSNSETASTTVEENRIRLCEEFAAIAETDVAVAQCYLADNGWKMEVKFVYMEVKFIYMLNAGRLIKKSTLETLERLLLLLLCEQYVWHSGIVHVYQACNVRMFAD